MSAETEEAGLFRAQLNRVVMGSWLAATLVSVTLEALALIMGVGSIIDWLLLITFAGISAVIAMHVFDKRPVLIVSPEGVHDRRISSRMIPWDDMLWHRLEVHRTGPVLGVGLTDEAARAVGVHPWAVLFKNQQAPFGKTKGYRIWATRTRGEDHEFVRAVQRFAPNRHDR